ncbi:hypothetical protein [Alicyclobacillus dauci]|uniref:Uncharacterized protein n=1 Tax=Alicyclobacillus dauci TaxID=1475485 RepID=A0ABY6YZS2_9BACL|nr:hypothetical protein [Alicyclobacillus dauci]WAH35616.1 hypothetical protein NZD86_15200 [Alicyclobacillus dauci]
MWQRAKRYLEEKRPVYEGIDIDQLIHDIDHVFNTVPTDWRNKTVPPLAIQQLELPSVDIHILDTSVRHILPDWIPQPLD